MKKLLRSNRNNLLHDASLHRGDTFTEKLRIAFLAVALCLISIAWSEAQTISNCPTLAATEIAGSVWKDYNYNGAKDETLVGVQGVTVKAYDCNGILVGTVTTDGSGNYKFTGMVAGQKYRIEFTLPAIVSSSYNLTKAGAGGRTTVQFVQAGQCASLGIARPEDYCEANPLLATTCFANGDPLVNGTAGPDGALVTFDNNSIGNGTATGTDPATKAATASQIGSSFGIAWDRKNKKMLVSAFAKRHVGFGPLGEGGIYQVDYSSGAPVVSNWLDVKTLGIPVDNVGTGTTIADRNISRGLVGDKLAKSLDAAGYTAVGKTSIGNIEFNKNADTLFFVNLTNRTIYAINVGTKTLAGTYPPPTVAGCAGTFRIFALKYHEGKLFMGGVCDGTTPSNMNSKVYRLDGTTWTEIFSMTMDYSKGYAFWGSCINNTGWYPWTDTPPAACDIQGGERGFVYPTPIFSDIEFDVDGSMILAFMDRTAHQIGWRNASPTNINDTWSSFVGGDILRIYNNNGTYVLENNGTAGPNTSGGANKGQGPGGGEFYFHDFLFEPHAETSMGGLAFRKGSGEIALTAMDPFETRYDSGGINWFSNSTGASSRNQGYYVYAGPESFGKSAGLGDVEYLCGLAPIEIGNRVWIDLDKDGIQDPCEGSLPNMNVSLYKGNTLIATTKTNAQGEYYFSSKSALAVGTWSGTGADTALLTNTAYKLVFAEGQSTAGLVTLSGLGQFSISPKDVTANNGNDQNDSDVALQGGSIGINLTTGSEGASNHSFDAGFIPLSSPIFCGMLIDSLTTVQNSLTNGRVSSVQSSSILLGGERDMNFVSNIPTSSTTTLFEVGPYFAGGNVIEITNQAASSSTLTVQWDGLDGDAVNLNPTGLGGLNFAALGINRLKAQLNADFPPNTNDSLQIRLELYTNAGAASRITKNFKFTSSTFNAIEFKFSDLVPFVGSGVDLSNIGAVVMFIDMSPNTVSTRTGWDVLLKDLTLECCTKPVASATPRTQTICVGGIASAFTATPSTGVEYKWYGPLADTTSSLGTAAVSGATSATFTPSGAVLTTAGVKYYAVVVNTTGDVNCADTAFVRLVVNAKPVIADGSATICAGESVDLTSKITSYNTYLSPVWTVGTANGTLVTTPSSVKPTGTTTYVLVAQNAAGCKDTANVVVTVNAKPSAGKDTTLACVNAATNTLATSYTLVPSPAGGSWLQLGTSPTTATISGNNVTGMSVTGTYQFIYTTTAGCKDTVAVTVAPCAGCVKPNAGADAANVCQPTSTVKLTAVTAGGTWAPIGSPANPSAATIDANGNISGLNAAGTYRFVYSVMSGGQTCTDTAQVVVLAKPVIADGSATICAGESVDLTSKITSYNTYLSPVWTVGTANGTAVTTPASVKPTGTTTYVLVAQNAAGCKDTANVVVTVNAKPSAGVDQTICAGSNATLTGTANTGTWTAQSNNPAGATLGTTASGVASVAFTSSASGAYNFIYNIGTCSDTVKITVNSCEAACADQVMAFSGRYNYTVIGNVENSGELAGPGQCMDAGSSSRTLTIPTGSTVKAAYLYWSGSANNTNGNVNVDNSVTLNGTTVNATRTWTRTLNLPPRLDFYGAFADVTSLVTAGGAFTLTNLDWDNAGTECDFAAAYGGWSMVVVYENPSLPPSEITLYDTFDGVFSSNEFDQTTKLCNLNLSPCIKSSELTIISWEGDSYKGETTFINGVNQGDNLLNGQNSFDGTSNFNLDIDKFNLSSIVNASTNEINYRVNSYNVFYNGSFAREFHITNALVFKYIKDDPTVTVADVSVCTGETATLTATGCTGGTISWNNGTTGTTLTVTNVVVNQSFTATCTINGCTASDAGTIIVKAKPTLSATPVCDASGTTYRVDFSATGTVTASAGTVSGSSVVNIPVGTSVTIRAILDGCKDSTIVISPSCSVPKGSLGDFVWKDTNNNGIQDETTPNGGGVAGVQVELYKVGTTAAIAKDTTEATGKYLFTNLDAGQYYIKIVAASIPAGCAISAMKDVSTSGGTEANDSDVDPTTGQSGNYVIDPFDPTKKDILTVDAALYSPCIKPNAGPDAANVCQPTSTAKLTAVTAGGTWAPIVSPANPSAATIDANGNISGLNAAGTYKFVYSVTSGGQTCTDTAQVIVLAKPVIADGSATICAGESVDLTSKITNYNTYLSPVWTIGTANGTAVATPNSVKPTGTTTYVLVAQNAAGCKDTANVVVTVNAKPSAGKDTTLVCSNGNVPSSVQLSATPTGGTWSALTGNPTGATVSSSGLVSITNATAQGKSFNFVYSVNGCQDTVKVIIPTCPAPCVESTISSAAPVCSNDAQTYSFTFTVNNQLGIVKVNKGTLSGSNPYTVLGIPSGQNVIITDSLSAICKTDTTIAGVNCNCNPALPQLLTPSLTACIGDTFPTLKATVVGLATVEWFSQQTGGTVLFTGLNYKPSGTVAANTVFYAQARSTDPTCPTAVSTSRVPATINAQSCIDTIDLALKKSINTKIARVGDVLTYTIKVWNEWTKNATGVEVVDSIATTVQFVSGSFVASRGSATISGNVIKWNIGNIAAAGDTVTLRYQVKATQAGIHLNTAEISKTNEKDRDSTPGNGKGGEDDIDQECFTVPFELCAGQKLEVGVPANLTNVQWFKNGGTTSVATGNVVLFSEVGVYTFTATNQTCPANGCCPVIIEAGTNCCPVDLCIPFTVKKVKK
ncbi:SdrD B-like domain-containing protein [Runella sp. SP2]|uniref:SdrD B-like domain-containing protein n=1 Tax=Runella sp. SP2 TaxID=2268026 RepID=UPI000F09303D|nr:SdrD B-like domain-containing protein [Runella sp. SP2]AYQ33340.1 DUF11 domain-containing protein [Runella sp. SP2]